MNVAQARQILKWHKFRSTIKKLGNNSSKRLANTIAEALCSYRNEHKV